MITCNDYYKASINNIVTTYITDFDSLLCGLKTFNEDISNWDVSSVTNMSNMFRDASAFNQDLGNWNVNNVTDMTKIFDNTAMNGRIEKFNSNVTNQNWSIVFPLYLATNEVTVISRTASSDIINPYYLNNTEYDIVNDDTGISHWKSELNNEGSINNIVLLTFGTG